MQDRPCSQYWSNEQDAGHKIMQIPLCVLSHFTNKAPIMSCVDRTYLYSKYFTLSARDQRSPCVLGETDLTSEIRILPERSSSSARQLERASTQYLC